MYITYFLAHMTLKALGLGVSPIHLKALLEPASCGDRLVSEVFWRRRVCLTTAESQQLPLLGATIMTVYS